MCLRHLLRALPEEAVLPGALLRFAAVSVPAPTCCDRCFLSTDGWRGRDKEGEVMQSQTLVPTK